jgi:hypothetical protein
MPYLARKNAITLIEEAIRDFRYFYGTLPPRARRTYEGTLFSEGAARLTAAVEKEGFRNMLPALDSAGFEIVYKTFYILAKNLNLAAYEAFNRQDLITLENLQAALGALHRDSEVDDVLRGFSTAELASLPF